MNPYLLAFLLLMSSGGYLPFMAPVRTIHSQLPNQLITWYSCSVEEGTEDCITASGVRAEPGMAAHKTLPFGTRGEFNGIEFTVTDRGGGLGPNHFDLVAPSRGEAIIRGIGIVTVTLLYVPD